MSNETLYVEEDTEEVTARFTRSLVFTQHFPFTRPPWAVCSTGMIIGHINILQNNHIHTDMQKSFATVTSGVDGERVSFTDDGKRITKVSIVDDFAWREAENAQETDLNICPDYPNNLDFDWL